MHIDTGTDWLSNTIEFTRVYMDPVSVRNPLGVWALSRSRQ